MVSFDWPGGWGTRDCGYFRFGKHLFVAEKERRRRRVFFAFFFATMSEVSIQNFKIQKQASHLASAQ